MDLVKIAKNPEVVMRLRVPDDWHERLERIAKKEYRSISKQIAIYVERGLERDRKLIDSADECADNRKCLHLLNED